MVRDIAGNHWLMNYILCRLSACIHAVWHFCVGVVLGIVQAECNILYLVAFLVHFEMQHLGHAVGANLRCIMRPLLEQNLAAVEHFGTEAFL